jgi:hypothetical protein
MTRPARRAELFRYAYDSIVMVPSSTNVWLSYSAHTALGIPVKEGVTTATEKKFVWVIWPRVIGTLDDPDTQTRDASSARTPQK